MMVKTNDMHLVIYISSLIRCVIQLHDLVNNKIAFSEAEADDADGAALAGQNADGGEV